jgi:acyl transferase domain-containing protein
MIKRGVDCLQEIPPQRWQVDDYFDPDPKAPDRTYGRRGAFLEAIEFDPLAFGIAPRDLEATDSTQLLALIAAQQALADAGVEIVDSRRPSGAASVGTCRQVPRERIAVILGVTGPQELVIPLGSRLAHPHWRRGMRAAGIAEAQIEQAVRHISEQFVAWQENSFPGLLGNVVAGRIANRLNLGGTNCVVDAACASALAAVEMAALELQTRRADVVITGGCDTFSDIFMYMCFSKTPALSRSGEARPFDADGDGTILGEGLGLVVLKRLSDAEAAGDRIYAVLRSIGSSSDGRGAAIYAPSAEGQMRCLRQAYELAGVTPDTIELVEAHGTGTKVGDATEAQALIEVYSAAPSARRRPWCALGSVKSQIGHTKAAAGAASLIKAILALYHKVLPPTLKVRRPVEPLRTADSPFYLNTSPRPWLARAEHPRRAAVSAFGFGGSNFHAVLEEYQRHKDGPDWDGQVQLFPLAADRLDQLHTALQQLPTEDDPLFALAEAARQQWRYQAPYRLVLVLERGQAERASWWRTLAQQLPVAAQQHRLQVTDGAYLGQGAAVGKLAVLFPGQGSQSVGMLRELVCLFPEMLEALNEADAVCGPDADGSLAERIYPPPAWDQSQRQAQSAALQATEWAQPALGALCWGLWRVLQERFGLTVSAWAGHSYGELVALAAAGCYSSTTLWHLSRQRGRLLASVARQTPSGMLAVRMQRPHLERWLAEQGISLVLANHNAPQQQVLSGALTEIERAAALLTQQKISCLRLPVAGAFHSPLVAPVVEPFRQVLQQHAFHPPRQPVYANSTATPYPSDPNAIRTLLAEQLVRPVAFMHMIHAMIRDGCRCFLEVGPGTVLTRLVAQIAAEQSVTVHTLAVDDPHRPGLRPLATALAQLAALGYPVLLQAWERESRCRPQPRQIPPGRCTVFISGANYRNNTTPQQPAPSPARPPATSACSPPVTPTPTAPPTSATPQPTTPPQLPQTHATITPQVAASTTFPPTPGIISTPALHSGVSANTFDLKRCRDLSRTTMKDPQTSPNSSTNVSPATTSTSCTPVAMPPSATPGSEPWSQQLLQLTQQSIALVQRIQEQTAALHKQFLDTQETAQRTLLALIEQQRHLWLATAASANPQGPSSNGQLSTSATAVEPPHYAPAVAGSDSSPSQPATSSNLLDSARSIDRLSADPSPVPPLLTPPVQSLATPPASAQYVGHPASSAARTSVLPATAQTPAVPSIASATAAPSNNAIAVPTVSVSATPPADSPSTPPPPQPPAQHSDTDPLASILLTVVSEKTGYPVDSLGWDLALDADLGIDSIKRVEIFSALQERLPQAPAVQAEHLGQLHTLRDVLHFLHRHNTTHTATTPPTAPLASHDRTSEDPDFFSSAYPAPPPKSIEAISPPFKPTAEPSAATTCSPSPSRGAQPATDWRKLLSRQVVRATRWDGDPGAESRYPAGSVVWLIAEPTDPLGELLSAALQQRHLTTQKWPWDAAITREVPTEIAGLVLIAPASDRDVNPLVLNWLQRFHRTLSSAAAAQRPFIVSLTRLDGAFGLGSLRTDASVWQGGLAGWIKTARREWPQVFAKAIDIAPEWAEAPEMAATVAAEILKEGPVEIGLPEPWQRLTLTLEEAPPAPSAQWAPLQADDVLLITGGGRGVTAEVAIALAESGRGSFILIGRTPFPQQPEPDWLPHNDDEAAWRRAISQQLGQSASPRQIQQQYHLLRAQRELRQTWQRLSATGVPVAYYAIDVADKAAV